jgi:hypothetical protein
MELFCVTLLAPGISGWLPFFKKINILNESTSMTLKNPLLPQANHFASI